MISPFYTPAETVAERIQLLLDAGWTRVELAERLHIGRRTLHSILNGATRTTTPYTANALFALDPQDLPTRVLPTGSMRRVQGLAAIGWPLTQLARDTGLHVQFLRDLAAGRYRRIPRHKAVVINRLSRARFLTPGPSKVARRAAARNGWLPVTVWEDPDDPSCEPDSQAAA